VIGKSDVNTDEEQGKELIKGILNFSDLEVKEIMRSRVDLIAFDDEDSFEDIFKLVIEHGYSRYPVYHEQLDNIKGILNIKDVLPSVIEYNKNFAWQNHLREAYFVPENFKINKLLKEFQNKKNHIAVVVDEYGGTSGIVTLEDILEEIVGEIDDEFDSENDGIIYKKIDDFTWEFDGKTSLNDFCKITGYVFDDLEEVKDDAETLAGLILALEGKFPKNMQKIIYENIEFYISAMDNRRIKTVKVTFLSPL